MITMIKRALGVSVDGDIIGSIEYWAGPARRVPMNYAVCEGQRMSIRDNPALYSIIGAIWGGDGKEYFNLPDLRPKDAKGAPLPWGTQPIPLICVRGFYPQFE